MLAALLGSALSASLAVAQAPLVVIVDAGQVRLDADALRAEVGAATGREVVAATDPRAGESDLLVLAHVGARRWVLRYQHADHVAWVERSVRPGALRAALGRASVELATEVLARALEPAAASRETAVLADAQQAPRRAWTLRPPTDLLDPFARWDPLRMAFALALVEPFEAPRARARWAEVVDPFVHELGAPTDIVDPWSP